MTCPNATAPRDITRNVTANCSLKCDYSFAYPISAITAGNKGTFLSFRVDKASTAPVLYNADNYELSEARLYTPSLHTYGGQIAKAELILVHNNIGGRGTLLVCVPVNVVQNSTSDSVRLLDTILAQCAKTATTAGQQTVINTTTLSLNACVPTKPFFSYTATLPFEPCNGDANYVVFSNETEGSAATISYDAFLALGTLIKPHAYKVQKTDADKTPPLFYNSGGAKKLQEVRNQTDNVYIECNPTGDEGQTLVPNNRTSAQLFSTGGLGAFILQQNILFQAVVGILVIIVMMKICAMLLNKLTGDTVVVTRNITSGPNLIKLRGGGL